MASKFLEIIKATSIYEDICALMSGDTASTACGALITAFSPYCNKEKVGGCFTAGGGTSGDPTINVTVSWTDCSAAGPADVNCQVQWLGQDFYNGETKEVCPTTYVRTKYTFTTTNTTFPIATIFANEFWSYSSNSTFSLNRQYAGLNLGPSATSGFNTLRIAGLEDVLTFLNGVIDSSVSSLNIIMGEPVATEFDYLLTDGYFSSTTIAGITYTWQRAQGW